MCTALCAALCASLSACACNQTGGGAAGPPQSGQSQSESGQGSAPSAGSADYDMAEKVIVDNARCAFTVTSVDPDGSLGFTVHARCENRSDRTLMFSWDECSVNGWMADPFWAQEVTAGNRANVEISFDREELERCGIVTVDEIEFQLHIYDSDDWESEPLVSDDYAIYPTGRSAAQIEVPARVAKEGEQTLVDDRQCTFIVESVDPNGIMGYTLLCYLENKTDDELMFSWGDVAVNGTMIDPFWAATVESGKRAYAEISFFESDFEDNDIQSVEQIEFRLRVYDPDDWDDDELVDKVFTYRP